MTFEELDLSKALFRDLSLEGIVDKVSFNAMLSAFAYSSQWERGLQFLQTDIGNGLDSYGRVSAGTCFAIAALWEAALGLLPETFKAQSHVTHVFNVVVAGCARASQWQRCLDILRMMKSLSLSSLRVSPDDATYSSVISSCDGISLWPRAVALLAEAKAAQVERLKAAPISSCNAAITICGTQHEWRWSLWILDSKTDALDSPNVDSWPDLMSMKSALISCERASKWQECIQLLHMMRGPMPDRMNASRRCSGTVGVTSLPDLVSLTSCASACEKAQLWPIALQLLNSDALEVSFKTECLPLPWMVLCRAFATAKCWQRSLHFFTEMTCWNLHDLPSLDTVLKSLADATKWSHALLLLHAQSLTGHLAFVCSRIVLLVLEVLEVLLPGRLSSKIH